jgi:hypothetical protein
MDLGLAYALLLIQIPFSHPSITERQSREEPMASRDQALAIAIVNLFNPFEARYVFLSLGLLFFLSNNAFC